jgi:hypothetical protein
MVSTPEGRDDILVDPARYELDAAWVKEAPTWTRLVERILRGVRRQSTAIGMAAIVGVLWVAGARAHDTNILFAAVGAIVVMAVSAEFIDGKNDG